MIQSASSASNAAATGTAHSAGAAVGGIFDRRRLLLLLWGLLTAGFVSVSLIGYFVSKTAIRNTIIAQDLPLTSSNIYSEIQRDLIRPILISMTMAHDTFVRDWVLQGERDPGSMARFLKEVKERHGAFSSFFVSDKSGKYYTADGVIKRVSPFEPRDAWYYRVQGLSEDYEINVDPDINNADALTIFINYRVLDYNGQYIGATGIGLTVEAVRRILGEYQQRYQRHIYFVDQRGRRVEWGAGRNGPVFDLHQQAELAPLIDRILSERRGSYQFERNGDNHILHVNYLPELKWLLFVEQNEAVALANVRQTLYTNLVISLVVTLIVTLLIQFAFNRYQGNLEAMASTDKLTGLLNRHAFSILIDKLLAEYRRHPQPISVLIADLDHFKLINDQHGHLAGDAVLREVARLLLTGLRESDMAVRWGGEEFLLVLKRCDSAEAVRIADKLRQSIADTPIIVGEKSIPVTLSIGLTQFSGAESPDDTVKRADSALYAAKAAGRNRVESV